MQDSGETNPLTSELQQNFADLAIHRFSHKAMATLFEVFCLHPDREYALQAASAGFDLVDRLEQDLSRYIENSDISRINILKTGESTRVNGWTMECLRIAKLAYLETFEAFDVSLGSGLSELELVPSEFSVRVNADAIRIDLGGIGKGYAVDRVAELLLEWEINESLIHGGFSSVLALDPPSGSEGWPLTLSFPGGGGAFALIQAKHRVFSASGVAKGRHITDPRTGRSNRLRRAAWVSGSRDVLASFRRKSVNVGADEAEVSESPAAVAEAFSTAFMILETPLIESCCRRYPGLETWLLQVNSDKEGEMPSVTHLPLGSGSAP